MTSRIAVIVGGLLLMTPAFADAQERDWVAEITIGYAGLVDDATKNYLLTGATLRRHVTPRVSVGAEVVMMSNANLVRDRNVMLTGNVVFDVRALDRTRRVTPFLVGGVGMFWGRDLVRGGPFWSSDPAFTAGGGVRLRVSDAVSAAAEYRIGWELHQRVSASAGFHW
jgi:opacity protein-like surface antigen